MSDALPDHRSDTKVNTRQGEIPTRAKSTMTFVVGVCLTIFLEKAWPLNGNVGVVQNYSGSQVDVKLSQGVLLSEVLQLPWKH